MNVPVVLYRTHDVPKAELTVTVFSVPLSTYNTALAPTTTVYPNGDHEARKLQQTPPSGALANCRDKSWIHRAQGVYKLLSDRVCASSEVCLFIEV